LLLEHIHTYTQVLPVIAVPKMYLIHVYRDGLFYLAVVTAEGIKIFCPSYFFLYLSKH